jgi:hypothetical protein
MPTRNASTRPTNSSVEVGGLYMRAAGIISNLSEATARELSRNGRASFLVQLQRRASPVHFKTAPRTIILANPG